MRSATTTSVSPQRRMRRAARRALSAELGREAATRAGARADAVYPDIVGRWSVPAGALG